MSYELIPRRGVIGLKIYALLDELITEAHEDLREARIVLAWCTSWRPNVDGQIVLGKCRKASELDRELTEYDFTVLLNRGHWLDTRVPEQHRRALLDHELSHAAPVYDESGEPVYDERGRRCWRLRRHDLEEFIGVVRRHGVYRMEVEDFAKALRHQAIPEFTPCETCLETPGWVYVEDLVGRKSVTRCKCFLEWQQARALVSA